MKTFSRTLIFCLCLCLLFLSCSKKDNLADLELPSDSAMHDANRYALIIETYISVRDKPGDDGISISHARRLDIFKVEGLEIIHKDNEQILWVNLGIGWVPRSGLQLYPSWEKANTASKKLK